MKRAESDDPLELVGVSFPVGSLREADERMARVVVEEYALAGFRPAQLRSLFESPEYVALYRIRRRWGPRFVDDVVDGVFGSGSR